MKNILVVLPCFMCIQLWYKAEAQSGMPLSQMYLNFTSPVRHLVLWINKDIITYLAYGDIQENSACPPALVLIYTGALCGRRKARALVQLNRNPISPGKFPYTEVNNTS
jgi:hypothetical protein